MGGAARQHQRGDPVVRPGAEPVADRGAARQARAPVRQFQPRQPRGQCLPDLDAGGLIIPQLAQQPVRLAEDATQIQTDVTMTVALAGQGNGQEHGRIGLAALHGDEAREGPIERAQGLGRDPVAQGVQQLGGRG